MSIDGSAQVVGTSGSTSHLESSASPSQSTLATTKASTTAIPTLVHIDPHKPGNQQKNLHTRWHPDIPCIATAPLGTPFKVECIDYSGGQVCNSDCADDVLDLDHDSDHHLTGPFHIPGAKPGDVLEIDILDISPFESQAWGYSVTAPGLGSLDHPDHETQVTKTIWDFTGPSTSSRHVPHVKFHGRPHPGCIGTAPSREVLRSWVKREGDLVNSKGAGLAAMPQSKGAYVGQDLEPELRERIYREGARTAPGREHGGNIDISSIVKGSKVYLPVYVPGAKFSIGDLHFAEADGEPTTAIEMSGIVTLQIRLSETRLKVPSPIYLSSLTEPTYPRRLVFTGLSITQDGTAQSDMSGLVAYRNAAFAAIDHLVRFGWTREQAYVILSVAPIETRVVATANRPNFVISLGLPLDVFGINISPDGLRNAPYQISGPALPSKDRLRALAKGTTKVGVH